MSKKTKTEFVCDWCGKTVNSRWYDKWHRITIDKPRDDETPPGGDAVVFDACCVNCVHKVVTLAWP